MKALSARTSSSGQRVASMLHLLSAVHTELPVVLTYLHTVIPLPHTLHPFS